MEIVSSGSFKKIAGDTRNNWVTLMFVTKNRYNCFGKQSHIDTCTQAFHDLERHGFEFGELGFAENHVHLQVNLPKRYSIQTAETMLKSHNARRMFEAYPEFPRTLIAWCLLERIRAPRIQPPHQPRRINHLPPRSTTTSQCDHHRRPTTMPHRRGTKAERDYRG